MLQEHAKIVQFISLAGEVTGRKKLQKMIYIAKKMNFPFSEKFELHMYGPYSEELTLRVEELCEMGFLDEERIDKGAYFQYQYNVSGEGERFLETAGKVPGSLSDFIQKMQVKSSRFLELVSTLLYFDHFEKKEQIEKVQVVKNKLKFSEKEFEEAFVFLKDLEFISNKK
ncbi:YwgA family protein [Sporosarcina jiandibaonis]|uniref:YwgA family protein n=1 Tax=Sporosarcina jiandibaonis TaxID=2715535 RepID=UPI0015529920|nr:YwgA family protein [Sporosarcina jiandibaonis]